MQFNKIYDVIAKIKTEIEEISDLIPEDKKKIIRELVIKAAIAYGEAQINKAIKDD